MVKQNDTTNWDRARGTIRSKIGAWRVADGKIYNCNYSMLDDFVGSWSWFQVMALNATQIEIERRLAEWLEAVFICISWPDSRIWCNQVAAFAGTTRTPAVAAVCAGLLASNSRIYGIGPIKRISEFLITVKNNLTQSNDVPNFIRNYATQKNGQLYVPGYARPIARGDERVSVMYKLSYKNFKYQKGEHVRAAFILHDYLEENYNESINIGGFICAFLLDQKFTPVQISRLFTLITNGGMHACYADAADREVLSYLPLRCIDIEYIGKPIRTIS